MWCVRLLWLVRGGRGRAPVTLKGACHSSQGRLLYTRRDMWMCCVCDMRAATAGAMPWHEPMQELLDTSGMLHPVKEHGSAVCSMRSLQHAARGSEVSAGLQDGGFKLAFDPVKVKFKPSAKDMQVAEESGTDLAQAMLKAQRREQRQASSTPKSGADQCAI